MRHLLLGWQGIAASHQRRMEIPRTIGMKRARAREGRRTRIYSRRGLDWRKERMLLSAGSIVGELPHGDPRRAPRDHDVHRVSRVSIVIQGT